MGFFRFRRSARIGPGLRLNFSKRGASVSLGGRGATVNLSSRGVRTIVGIPGSGLSYTSNQSWSHRKSGKSSVTNPRNAGAGNAGLLFLVIFAVLVIIGGKIAAVVAPDDDLKTPAPVSTASTSEASKPISEIPATAEPAATPAVTAIPVTPASPSINTVPPIKVAFQEGLHDRAAWETWFARTTGDFRSGVSFWAAQRSLARPQACESLNSDPMVAGCMMAKERLAPADIRRKADPEYRAGWNSYR